MKKPVPFGKYQLLDRVNVGGMAEVFIGKSFGVEGFEKILAIKKILPTMAEDQEFITMFIDEARISSQLTHANVVQITELGKHDESYFIAMEYVPGRDVKAILERQRKRKEVMTPAMACYIVSRMCEGLDYAHRKKDARGQDLNIIHRDVSPQNILVSYEGEVKIIDFGIAKAAGRSQKTQAGILKGKFGYMSPEQVMGRPIDRRSDIFAVGVILFELLTNERLFVAESDFSTLEKVRNAEIPPLTELATLPPGLENVVRKALARTPEERYQWCSDLQEDLLRFLIGGDQVFTAKAMAQYMRTAFADEVKKESERMERFAVAQQGPPPTAPEPSAAPAPRKTSSSVQAAVAAPAPAAAAPPPRRTSPGRPAAVLPGRSVTPAAPRPAPGAAYQADDAVATEIVSSNDAMRKIAEYEAARAKKAAAAAAPAAEAFSEPQVEDTVPPAPPVDDTAPPLPPAEGTDANALLPRAVDGTDADALLPPSDGTDANAASPRVVIGDQAALNSNRTMIGELPPEPGTDAQLYARADDDESTANGRVPREEEPKPTTMLQAPSYDDAPADGEHNATKMLAAPDYGAAEEEELPPTGDADEPHSDEEELDQDDAAEPAEEDDGARTTAQRSGVGRSRVAAASRAAPAPRAPNPLLEKFHALEPKQRLVALGGGAAVLLLVVGLLVAALGGSSGPRLHVLIDPADVAQTASITVGKIPVQYGEPIEVVAGEDYEVEVSAPGYAPIKRRVSVREGEEDASVQITLKEDQPEEARPPPGLAAAAQLAAGNPEPAAAPAEPARPATFTAVFSSEVSGVELTLEGRKVEGLRAPDLAAERTYRWEARRAGYRPASGEVRADGDAAEVKVAIALEKEPPPAPAPAPKKVVEQPAPRPVVSAPRPKVTAFEDPPAPAPKVARSNAKGKLAAATRPPGAQVWIDGKNTGRTTPIMRSNPIVLPVGEHTVLFKFEGKTEKRTVVISENQMETVQGVTLQ